MWWLCYGTIFWTQTQILNRHLGNKKKPLLLGDQKGEQKHSVWRKKKEVIKKMLKQPKVFMGCRFLLQGMQRTRKATYLEGVWQLLRERRGHK